MRLVPVVAPVGLILAASPARAGGTKPVLSLSAFVQDPGSSGGTDTLFITIERWSTPAERDHLRDILVQQGEDALRSELEKIKPRVGYMRSAATVGWDLYFALDMPTEDGGRRIYLATDRPMSFAELGSQPASAQFPFTLVEIRLGKDGRGQGELVPAARVSYDEGSGAVEIENYQPQPISLSAVRVTAAADRRP